MGGLQAEVEAAEVGFDPSGWTGSTGTSPVTSMNRSSRAG